MSMENVFTFDDEVPSVEPYHVYESAVKDSHQPIVIDNGAYNCRVGFVGDENPRLIFKNVVGKQRDKNRKDLIGGDIVVGNDIQNLEVIRYQLKTQFDKDVVTHFESQEYVFDHIFSHLSIDSELKVDHPIVITEALCNPNYCRQQMSELLFECYHVPSLCYGVDGLFSFMKNNDNDIQNGIVISCGYATSYIMPILNREIQSSRCRRINIGGAHADFFLQRLLQLKYPAHMSLMTLSRAEESIRKHGYIAVDYAADMLKWREEQYTTQHSHIIQLPFIEANVKKLTPEQQRERRETQIRRLKSLAATKRQEKLENNQKELKKLLDIQDLEDEDYRTFARTLKNLGIADSAELQERVDGLEESITKMKHKFLADEAEVLGDAAFTLLNVPDEQLDIQQMETKRKQLRMREAVDAQQKQKKKDEKKEMSFNPPSDKKEFDAWLFAQRRKRQDLLEKREKRRQRKTEMTKRRSYASQQRMKIITELAQGIKRKKEDTFGMLDTDWDVYKQIQKGGDDSDSETEQEKLDEIEMILKEFDPQFIDLKTQVMPSTFNIKEYYRLYLNTERIRAPEVLFQPSMLGVEQSGIAEALDFVLKKFTPEEQTLLANNIFLTGGPASFPNMKERLERDLLASRPFQSKFAVRLAENPVLDAWRGACAFARSDAHAQYCVSRAEYDECGGEYLKEHRASNRYFLTPGAGLEFPSSVTSSTTAASATS